MNLLTNLPIGAPTTQLSTIKPNLRFLNEGVPVYQLIAQAKLTVTTLGTGTAVNVYIQTSPDGGTTWCDALAIGFTTATATKVGATAVVNNLTPAVPTDGALALNTAGNIMGDLCRIKVVSTGTFTAATLSVDINVR